MPIGSSMTGASERFPSRGQPLRLPYLRNRWISRWHLQDRCLGHRCGERHGRKPSRPPGSLGHFRRERSDSRCTPGQGGTGEVAPLGKSAAQISAYVNRHSYEPPLERQDDTIAKSGTLGVMHHKQLTIDVKSIIY